MLAGVGSYLRIEEDGTQIVMQAVPADTFSPEDCQMIEDGTLQIIRFVPFSAEAAAIAGGPGRWERLTAEGEVEELDEDDTDVEPEGEVTWTTEWEPIS